MKTTTQSIAEFTEEATAWVSARRPVRSETAPTGMAVFHTLSHEEEARLIKAAASWQAEKYQAGYGAIRWSEEYGGAGLSGAYERAFQLAEQGFDVPADHELRRITTNLVAPTIRDLGSQHLAAFIRPLLRCEYLVCQLFSEPGAGSDLAALSTRARRRDQTWIISGSKVWVSGAQFADYGLLLARSDPEASKHAGITAFLLPMSSPGVDVRSIRQMTGGSSFNEVFIEDVELDDGMRIGEVGDGWNVARTMLSYERNQSGSRAGVGGSWEQLRALASTTDAITDPFVRDRVVQVYMAELLRGVTRERAEIARLRGEKPGAEGSIGKLIWAETLTMMGEAAAMLAGPAVIVDTDDSSAYGWSEHLLGAPGFHIAGGTDEIQRNIISEKLLGLPRDPRASG